MVRFAVVGLGMGRGRSHLIQKTEGAELKCVIDLNEELAKKNGEAQCLAVVGKFIAWRSAISFGVGRPWLSRPAPSCRCARAGR